MTGPPENVTPQEWESFGFVYKKYKQHGRLVLDWLYDSNASTKASCKDIIKQARLLRRLRPPRLLPLEMKLALEECIRFRRRAETLFQKLNTENNSETEESTAGHAYFVSVLEELLNLLAPATQAEDEVAVSRSRRQNSLLSEQVSKLGLEPYRTGTTNPFSLLDDQLSSQAYDLAAEEDDHLPQDSSSSDATSTFAKPADGTETKQGQVSDQEPELLEQADSLVVAVSLLEEMRELEQFLGEEAKRALSDTGTQSLMNLAMTASLMYAHIKKRYEAVLSRFEDEQTLFRTITMGLLQEYGLGIHLSSVFSVRGLYQLQYSASASKVVSGSIRSFNVMYPLRADLTWRPQDDLRRQLMKTTRFDEVLRFDPSRALDIRTKITPDVPMYVPVTVVLCQQLLDLQASELRLQQHRSAIRSTHPAYNWPSKSFDPEDDEITSSSMATTSALCMSIADLTSARVDQKSVHSINKFTVDFREWIAKSQPRMLLPLVFGWALFEILEGIPGGDTTSWKSFKHAMCAWLTRLHREFTDYETGYKGDCTWRSSLGGYSESFDQSAWKAKMSGWWFPRSNWDIGLELSHVFNLSMRGLFTVICNPHHDQTAVRLVFYIYYLRSCEAKLSGAGFQQMIDMCWRYMSGSRTVPEKDFNLKSAWRTYIEGPEAARRLRNRINANMNDPRVCLTTYIWSNDFEVSQPLLDMVHQRYGVVQGSTSHIFDGTLKILSEQTVETINPVFLHQLLHYLSKNIDKKYFDVRGTSLFLKPCSTSQALICRDALQEKFDNLINDYKIIHAIRTPLTARVTFISNRKVVKDLAKLPYMNQHSIQLIGYWACALSKRPGEDDSALLDAEVQKRVARLGQRFQHKSRLGHADAFEFMGCTPGTDWAVVIAL